MTSRASTVQLLPAHSPEWSSYLNRVPHDFFHTAQYHAFSASVGNSEEWLITYGDPEKFVAWPYLLQPVEEATAFGKQFRDITSVYGYSGPLIRNCSEDSEFLSQAWNAFVETWRSQSVVSVFTRFHPILANQTWLRSEWEKPQTLGRTYQGGKTVVVDLSQPGEKTWADYERKLRQTIRRLERENAFSIVHDEDWAYLDQFISIYYATLRRNNAQPFYFFSRDYFVSFKQILGLNGSLFLALAGDAVAAGLLLIEYNGIVSVHLAASDHRFSATSPNKLLMHKAQELARARGNRFLHIGGGRGSRDDDPLFRFKAQFSSLHLPFYTGRWILDSVAYERLAAQRRQAVESQGQQLASTFFPIYRAPLIDGNAPPPDLVAMEQPGPSGATLATITADHSANGDRGRHPSKHVNVLISSAGRRVALMNCFRESLSALGVSGRIIAVDATPYSAAAHLADEFYIVPRCTENDFIPAVQEICEQHDIHLLIPTIDTELPTYAAARQEFRRRGTRIAISSPETVAICYNKILTHEWLTGLDLPVPRQATPEAVLRDTSAWNLPLIVKPVDGSGSLGVHTITSFAELDALSSRPYRLIVQECIEGAEHTINVFVNNEGRCLCTVPHLRIEVRGGEVAKGVTVKDRRLMELAATIVESMPGVYGALNVQCFRTITGDVKIIEINARFGGGYPLAHRAGGRITQWLVEEALGREVRQPFDAWEDGLTMLRYDEAVFASREALRTYNYAVSAQRVKA